MDEPPLIKKSSLLLILLVVPVFWGVSHVQASHSEGFKFFRCKLMASPAVALRIGKVNDVRLALLGRYSAHYSTSYTRVHMAIDALGSKGQINMEIDADQNDEGIWERATTQGTPLLID